MNNIAGRITQWALLGVAVVCLFVVIWLTESRPTITYTQPTPDEQQVVVSCGQTAWGMSDHHSVPTGGSGTSWYRVVEGEEVIDDLEGVNSAELDRNCLVAGDRRQHHIIWTTAGGLLLAGAGAYVNLRRRIDAQAG